MSILRWPLCMRFLKPAAGSRRETAIDGTVAQHVNGADHGIFYDKHSLFLESPGWRNTCWGPGICPLTLLEGTCQCAPCNSDAAADAASMQRGSLACVVVVATGPQ